MKKQCPICNFPTKYYDKDPGGSLKFIVKCYKCGDYWITTDAESNLKKHPLKPQQSANLSGWLRSNQRCSLDLIKVKELKKLKSLPFNDKVEIVLSELLKKFPSPGDKIPDFSQIVNNANEFKKCGDFPTVGNLNESNIEFPLYLYSKSRAKNISEFSYITNIFLRDHKKYLKSVGKELEFTPYVWEHIENILIPNKESHIAFIAMKFEDKLKKFSDEYFEAAIIDAGYKPIRIDKHEHNKVIDDEMIATIRKSRFIIADYTGNSHGVYFEAGFAQGFNLEVIRLCNEEYFNTADGEDKIHFDQNHYPILMWNWNEGPDIQSRLQNKIESTIGKGNYVGFSE